MKCKANVAVLTRVHSKIVADHTELQQAVRAVWCVDVGKMETLHVCKGAALQVPDLKGGELGELMR